jgi:hypothetical protein
VLPGLVNAHTHAHNALLKGLADRWTLEDLLTYGAALNANRTVEEQYLSASLNAVEMVKTGCTAAYDLFMAVPAPTAEGVEAVVRAYTDVGLRATLAPATWLARNVRQAWDGGVCRMLGLESLAGLEPALSDGMEHVSAKRVRTPTSGRESRVRDQTDRLQKPESSASKT